MNVLGKLRSLLGLSTARPAQAVPVDSAVFDEAFYQAITTARLEHFQSLGMDLRGKSVIDVGCGIGRLSQALADLGAEVFCVDGRSANIERLRELYPGRRATVVDVETEALLGFGQFDVVFCYGLLYHLADPMGFIRRAASICRQWLVLETCIMDASEPVVRLVPEEASNYSQALHAMGCRPSSAYVAYALKLAGMRHVYVPTHLPDHPQFRYVTSNDYADLKDGSRIRNIFVASRKALPLPALREL